MDDILQKYSERVLVDIFLSKEYLSLYAKLYELPKNNSEIYDTFKDFWHIAKSSFLYSGTITLAKVFDYKDEQSITLHKILKYSQANKPTEKATKQIEIFYKEIDINKEKIENLIYQRDKFYAHNDKISTKQLLGNAHLTYGDKLELLNLGKKICEYFLAHSQDEKNTPYLVWNQSGSGMFDTILYCLKQHKELIDNIVDNEFC